jgi:flagellar motor switch protein FliM
MSVDRVLSQEEIDTVLTNLRDAGTGEPGKRALAYDFRRPDRIAKDQLRAIHVLHENFARSLASSLSAYLRAYVMVNLVSVEQLAFAEFSQCLPSPTCIVSLTMKPYEGNAVIEINPSLLFPILEMLLGGNGRGGSNLKREVTEIEQSILDGLFRIVLHDLKEAWRNVTNIEFGVDQFESEAQLLQILAPNEAVVAVSMEVRIGESAGMINLGIPSILIKMLRQKFDQQWSVRKSESTEDEMNRILRLIGPSRMHMDTRLIGPTLTVSDLLALETGDVLTFDFPISNPVALTVNGRVKFEGVVGTNGRNRSFQLQALHRSA